MRIARPKMIKGLVQDLTAKQWQHLYRNQDFFGSRAPVFSPSTLPPGHWMTSKMLREHQMSVFNFIKIKIIKCMLSLLGNS